MMSIRRLGGADLKVGTTTVAVRSAGLRRPAVAAAQPRPDAGAPGGGAAADRSGKSGFDQNLNQMLPLDVELTDEHGRTVKIGDYFGKRPVVLSFVYYGCPMLCLQSLSSLAATLGVLSENPGEDFEVVSVSIDPRETPVAGAREESALRASDRASRRSRRAGTS